MTNEILKCTVCETEINLPEDVKHGDRITCPNCFAQLSVVIQKNKKQLRCALCITPKQEVCTPDCERKISERERRGFFDIKL